MRLRFPSATSSTRQSLRSRQSVTRVLQAGAKFLLLSYSIRWVTLWSSPRNSKTSSKTKRRRTGRESIWNTEIWFTSFGTFKSWRLLLSKPLISCFSCSAIMQLTPSTKFTWTRWTASKTMSTTTHQILTKHSRSIKQLLRRLQDRPSTMHCKPRIRSTTRGTRTVSLMAS